MGNNQINQNNFRQNQAMLGRMGQYTKQNNPIRNNLNQINLPNNFNPSMTNQVNTPNSILNTGNLHINNNQGYQINRIIGLKENENIEFIKNIENILKQPHTDERTENLGEVIFYFLLDLISKFNLNVTKGQFDDTILCSKLTGILINEDDQEIYSIVSKNENLLVFINNVIMVK